MTSITVLAGLAPATHALMLQKLRRNLSISPQYIEITRCLSVGGNRPWPGGRDRVDGRIVSLDICVKDRRASHRRRFRRQSSGKKAEKER